jgi:hypothetical protein
MPRATATVAYSAHDQEQAQSSDEPATGSVIGVVRKPYDRQPHEPSEDERLGPAALGILSYVFSRPPTWDISVKQLEQRFDGHRLLIREALKQLEQTGWAVRAQLRSPDSRRACGQMWFFRRSLDEPWPKRFATRGLDSLRVRILKAGNFSDRSKADCQDPTRLINTDIEPPLSKKNTRDTTTRGREREPQLPPDHPSLGREGYQDQPKSKPDKARIAQMLASNWGERPLASHPKWPEFWSWCRGQRGKPNEKGFWTWLAGQPAYWRDKVKPPDEIPGFMLDGKFYEAAAANELCASDPIKYDASRFRQAMKRNGKVEIIEPS